MRNPVILEREDRSLYYQSVFRVQSLVLVRSDMISPTCESKRIETNVWNWKPLELLSMSLIKGVVRAAVKRTVPAAQKTALVRDTDSHSRKFSVPLFR